MTEAPLVFASNTPWYKLLIHVPQAADNPPHEVKSAMDRAAKIYNYYVEEQEVDELTESIIKEGTIADKYAAMKTCAQQTPLLMLRHLETLNDMLAGKPRKAIDAMRNAAVIYTEYLLPPDRPLRKFENQPIHGAGRNHLLLFYFEEKLRTYYADFINKIEKMARSHQAFLRDPAIRTIADLLRTAPEAERVLLNILVNKFGDPLKQVASVATNAILSILKEQPDFTPFVVDAIKKEMPKFSEASQKRTQKFLGQLKVNPKNQDAAHDLFETVQDQLLDALKSDKPEDNKVRASLMRAAQKHAQSCSPEQLKKLIEPLYAYAKDQPISNSLPAMQFLFVIHKRVGSIPVDFYAFFYNALLSDDFTNSSKHAQILNLLLDCLSECKNNNIIACFVHRLLAIGLHNSATFTIAILITVIKLFDIKPELRKMLTEAKPEMESTFNCNADNFENIDGAIYTFPWICAQYATHYHPAVRELADAIISGIKLSYDGDVFNDFSMPNHLARIIGEGHQKSDDFFNDCFSGFDKIPEFDDTDDDENDNK